MDGQHKYRQIIHHIILSAAEQYGSGRQSEVDQAIVTDDLHGIYQIYEIGWREHDRVKTPWVHVRLKNGKFWIEEDWTEESIAEILLAAGVPHADIVLAFNPPDMREYTDFAMA